MAQNSYRGVQWRSCLRCFACCGTVGCGFWPLVKAGFGLIIIALVVFFAEEYYTFGMWDAGNFTLSTGCSEEVYNFESSETESSVLTDTKLMTSCGVYSANQTESKPSYNMFRTSTETPTIRTKCGTKKGELISYHISQEDTDPSANKVVPNIVHYITIGHWEFTFLNYLSFRSVDKFIKPQYIFMHGDGLPYGEWWSMVLKEVPNIYYVKRAIPQRIQGRKSRWLEHSSDIMRLQTILDNGGIYVDTDILVVKSFDPLRRYPVTLGRESSFGLGSGIIVAEPRAPFVCMWFNVFREYNPFPWNWATYAVHTPHKLAAVLPDLVHVEENTLHSPSFQEPELLFEQRVDWSKKYAVHVWKRYGTVPSGPDEIKNLNTTLGQIMRHIYSKR